MFNLYNRYIFIIEHQYSLLSYILEININLSVILDHIKNDEQLSKPVRKLNKVINAINNKYNL